MGVVIVPEIEKQSITKLISEGKRLDGRAFDEFRPISIETGTLERAEGSAIVKIGDTQVAAGIKMGEGEPYPDSPDVGVLSTNAELVPMASPEFRSGPPDEHTIELARVIDRGIRESQCIDLKKLCIEPGEKTRMVFIDAYVLDHDGNFIDTGALAAIAALHNAEVEDFGKLPVSKKPIACTFVKIGGNILLDPTLEEERIADARLTVTTEEDGNVCAMQKAGKSHWTADEVMQCVKTSLKKGKEIRKLLK
jgi:exosome complex component RRP42